MLGFLLRYERLISYTARSSCLKRGALYDFQSPTDSSDAN